MSSSTGTNPGRGSDSTGSETNGAAATGAGSGSTGTSRTRGRQVTNVAVLTDSELGSEAQRERRKRILKGRLCTQVCSRGLGAGGRPLR